MVVPAIRVVIHNDYGGIAPCRLLLQEVNHADREYLFVDGIRISSVSILIGRGLKEAYGRLISGGNSREEIVGVVLVVGGTVGSDFSNAGRAGVVRVGGRIPICKQGVVRSVVDFLHSSNIRGCAAIATRASVGIRNR